jgi:phage shock protein E
MKKLSIILTIIMIAVSVLTVFAKDSVTPVIIDARTAQEFDKGHVEGAILIPYDQIGEKIGSFVKDKSQKVYIYCRSGRRSKIAKETLEKLGYKDIVDLGSLQDAAKILNRKIVNK